MISVSGQELKDLSCALEREWIETNGLGGYASSTVINLNTRKYHGLLAASLNPPVERKLLVSRLDETVIIDGSRLDISSAEYEDCIHPRGYHYLEMVRLDPWPVFTYVAGGVKIEKAVFMVHGENTVCVRYSLGDRVPNGPRPSQVILEVRPILGFRDHHSLMAEDPAFDRGVSIETGKATFRPYPDMPELYLSHSPGRFEEDGHWYLNYRLRREEADGYPWNEDLYSPGRLVFSFDGARTAWLVFSTDRAGVPDVEQLRAREEERRERIVEGRLAGDTMGRHLLAAADAFMVRRGEYSRSIIAGYPWFTDWGRDTMISLPGLALVTGRHDEARRIISAFLANMKGGLIPNLFPDGSEQALYNTFDATLWLFEAVRKYYDYTGDTDFVGSILPGLREIVNYHAAGTMFGIGVDEDGLLAGGQHGVQLTWMDAKVKDKVVTARIGKPVEVNALWYNALRITAGLCSDFGGLAEEGKYEAMASRARESFNREFWNEARGCLYDVVAGVIKDGSVRPNQVLAISLTHPVLDESRWQPVMDVVTRELLTPFGLRTLSPFDPSYEGRYEGDLRARDHAYHQGTVWPWLLGPYITAYVRTRGRSPEVLAHCRRLFEPFRSHLKDAGLGSISEIFDGDPPHNPRGCIAQAWSVAELLRALAEDLIPAENSRGRVTS
jgi:predicted glycogen debranching enzyme